MKTIFENKIFKIACGSNGDDYDWTDKVMKIAGNYMDAITLHHYTVPGGWNDRGSATEFNEEKYFATMERALYMDTLITKHLQIMSRYDEAHKVGLIVDEWGTWFDVEEGTNPGFLYQQNTMRDALVAAATLNIFNKHSDRVIMANIAQTVNVLQAVILTEGEKMVLTPTYHVFDLFKVHQDATLVDSYIETSAIGKEKIPNLSASVSESESGLHITIANFSLTDSYPIDCDIVGMKAKAVDAEILTEKVNTYNDFTDANCVKITKFNNIQINESGLKFEIPPCSVMRISVQ